MVPDTESPFGHYRPDESTQSLISLSQKAKNNLLGRQLAKFIRNRVKKGTQPPLDLEIESLKLRCYLWDNYTERKLIFMPWRFDIRERQQIFSLLPRDGVFVDIGANVGVYSLLAATQMNNQGRVLALEPYPPIYDRLNFNIQATQQDRSEWPTIKSLPVGVADKPTTFELHLNPDNFGKNSIIADAETASAGQVVNVQCQPLISILEQQSIEHIDVLKIDIEGAEDLAMCPFLKEALDALLPNYILMENSENRWQMDLQGALKTRGYTAILNTRLNTLYRSALVQ